MIRTLFTSLRRSPYQTAAAVLIMVLSFFVGSVYFLSAMSAQRILTELSTRPQVIAFLKDEAKPEDISKIKENLGNQFAIKDWKYLSKEDALGRYKEQNKNDQLLLELVTANILPASIELSVITPGDLEKAAVVLKKEPIVDDVVFPKEETASLISWVNSIRFSGIILVSALMLESLLVLLVVFALKIAYRKEEISVLRLVGANRWQVRGPYLLEGLLYGLLAALFSQALSFLFVFILKINPLGTIPALASFSEPFALNLPNIAIWTAGQMGVGILVGVVGSFIATWRYLRD